MIDLQHRAKIGEFFTNNPAGVALLQELRERKPRAIGDTIEKVALNAKKSEGWEECIDEIDVIIKERPVNADELAAGPQSMDGVTEKQKED